jgi:hypothetical protein
METTLGAILDGVIREQGLVESSPPESPHETTPRPTPTRGIPLSELWATRGSARCIDCVHHVAAVSAPLPFSREVDIRDQGPPPMPRPPAQHVPPGARHKPTPLARADPTSPRPELLALLRTLSLTELRLRRARLLEMASPDASPLHVERRLREIAAAIEAKEGAGA